MTIVQIDRVLHFATIPDRSRVFALLAPFRVSVMTDTAPYYREIEAPTGFVTDFASVPRLIWSWVPPHGKYLQAAVTHDWLYHSTPEWITRKQADRLFLLMMREAGVGSMRRRLMHMAVRVGGAYAGNWKDRDDTD